MPAAARKQVPLTREELLKRRIAKTHEAKLMAAYDEGSMVLRGAPRTTLSALLERLNTIAPTKRDAKRLWVLGVPKAGLEPLAALAYRLAPDFHAAPLPTTSAAERAAIPAREGLERDAVLASQAAQAAAAQINPQLASIAASVINETGGLVGDTLRQILLANASALGVATQRVFEAEAARHEVLADVAVSHGNAIKEELSFSRNARRLGLSGIGNTITVAKVMPELFALAESEIRDELAVAEAARAAGAKEGRLDVDKALRRLNALITTGRNAMGLVTDASKMHRTLLAEARAVKEFTAQHDAEIELTVEAAQAMLDEVEALAATPKRIAGLRLVQGGKVEGETSQAGLEGEPL